MTTEHQRRHGPTERARLGPPVFEQIAHDPRRSFYWHTHGYPADIARWNYHPEYELHLIRRSSGRFVVGDHAGRFGPGHLVLVGPNLPHAWFSDRAGPDAVIAERDVVVQFRGEWLTALLAACPELSSLQALAERSRRGLAFEGPAARRAGALLEAMRNAADAMRLTMLIDVLCGLATARATTLASAHFRPAELDGYSVQVDAVLAYLHRHFDRPLRLADIAAWQQMSSSSFSRFFKAATGETFSVFLTRLRIEQACRRLLDSDAPIAEIGLGAGYANLSNFNRRFREATGLTPSAYRNRPRAER